MSKFILSIGISFFLLTSLHAQTFNGTGGVIPDGGPQTCFNINVTGVGTINGTYGLASVCLNITHNWDADLEIYLRAPDGTLVPLSIQNGVAGVNYTNTCFTATAATVITAGFPPYTGNFRPEGNLGTVNNGQNANGTWSLCIEDLFTPDAGTLANWSLLFNNTPAQPPVIPANDDPCNAIPLTVGAACSYSNYTNENATGSTGVPAPGCASYLGGDVWFSVTVPAGGALIFDTQTGVMLDGGMAIYSGTCNALTLIACDDDASTNGNMSMINATGLTPGSTVWIRVWEYGNDNNGTFGICVTTPPPPPTNDNPCNAFTLPVNNTCNFSYYTNVGATGTTGVPAPGCGNYQGADVWFTVTVPPAGSIIFDSNIGTMTDGDMAIYSGTCGALTLVQCDDLSSANGLMASITLTGQTPGATLWVRFWGYGVNNTGTFQLCASIPPPPTVQDCPAAIAICQNIYNEPISYTGTGSINNEINPANSCLANGERADVWYTFTVQTSGNLNFTITPSSPLDDYDWAVYNLTNATCADIYNNAALNVSCNYSSTPGTTGPTGGSANTSQNAGGTPYNAVIPVTAGQTYVINVSNFSLTNSGYTINFGASTASIFDNVPPHIQSVGSTTTCGGNQVSINFSENILCNTIQNADFTITGPGGPYTITNWASATCTAGATYANNVVLTVSPALATNGSYQVCLTNASASVTDLCGNVAPPGCLNFTISTTIPTFSPVASICNGSTPPVLPTTSTNGITGTWSPATVSNTATGTYTFTPNIGQCATTATLTVTVTAAGILPTFVAIPAFCSGSVAPVLPTTSTNGINGTWSPATVSNTASGTYTFTPNAGQCATTTTLSVTVNPQIIPTFAAVPAICSGSAAPVLPTTSTNGITGTWSPAIVSNTSSATYTFTPNAGQCATTATIPVTVNPLPTIYTHGTNPSCAGTCDGTATVDVVGGAAPYTYTWNNSGNTQTITGLCAGTYTVSVTDANGCVAPVVPPFVPGCFQIQSVLVDACSAVEYDQEMVFFQVGQNPLNTSSLTITWPTAANTWNGLCTDPAFIASVNATITGGGIVLPLPGSGILPPNANAVLITSTPATSANSFANLTDTLYALFQCPGNSQGHFANNTGAPGIRTLIMNFGAGCTDTTKYDPVFLINQNGTTGGSATLNNGAYVNYAADGTATYLNYGCVIPFTIQSSQVILTAPAPITPTFAAVAAICSGSVAPVLPATSTNGITGTWSPATVSNTSSGTYTFTPNAGQCATTTTLSVTVNTQVTPTFAAAAAICSGSVAPVLPTTSTNGITGTWAPATVSNTASGTYTFTPNAGQCATTTTLSVTVNTQVTPTFAAVAAICSGSVAPVLSTTSTNGINGTWSPAIVSNTSSGTYTFTPNAGQCATTTTLSVTVNTQVTPTFAAVAAICNGDVAPVLPTTSTNGITGTWAPATVSNTVSGTYTFTPNAGQCATTTTLSVTVNTQVTPTFAAVAAICSGSVAPVLPTTSTNGINGTWAPATVSNTVSGTYTFTPNAGQCATTTTLSVTVNTQVTPIFAAVAAICSGSVAPVLPTTSTNGINGTWSPATVSNTASGTYTFTPNAGQCATTTTLSVTVNTQVTPTFAAVATICSGSVAPVLPATSTNGINGTWSPATVSNTASGTYTFTPNAGQCATTTTLSVTVNTQVTPTFAAVAAICSGSVAPVLPATSTNGINGTWSPATVSNTASGTYTFTPNAGQCATTTTLSVTVNTQVTPTFAAVAAICSGSVAPVLLTTSTNGINGTWSPAAVSNTVSGTYTFTPNAGQCATTTTLSVTVNTQVTPTFAAVAAICSGSVAPVLPPTSTNGITGTWAPATVSNTASGTYTFTPNAGQCATTTTLSVTVNTQTSPTFAAVAAICSGSVAPVLPTTSTNGINGTWAPATVSNTVSGTYTFTPNAGQCATTTTLSVTVNTQTTPTFAAVAAICSGSVAPVLPTTSTNGITGTWAPATVSNTASGTYTFTPNAGQCATTATLSVTVKPIVTSTTNTTICSTQLPYTWNAQTYPVGGTYSVTLTSSSGCDSIATLNLTVNTVVTSTTNTTICSTQLPYTWNAQTYPTGGTYSVTLTSSSGCDSIATLNLTVNTVVTSTTNTTICSTQLPYTWNAQTYPTGGTYSVTLTSSSGCDSIATLNLTVNTVVTSTTNTTICSTQLPYTWNAQTYPTGGTYSVTLTSSSGCDSIATLNLTVSAVVTSTTNTTICSTQLPYTWNAQTYPAGGTYSVTLTSSSGCDSIATLNLTVSAVVTSTTNTTICSTQLPYTWNAQTYPAGGTYSVTLTSSSGCDSIATLNLTVSAVVTSTTNTTICSTQLPYTWNAQTYPTGGTYSVTLTSSSGCDSIATLNLTVSAVVTSTTNTTICSTQLPYAWNAQTYPAGGTYSVTLTSSSGCDSIATLNLTVNNVVTSTTNTTICSTQLPYTWNAQTYPAGGTYSVTLTSSSGCDSIATLNLTVSAVVTSTTNTTICSTQLPYTWNAQTYPTGGTYSVTLTSSSGCDSIATLNLTVSAVVTSTTNTTICSTQLPYTWNAQTYPAGGTYSVTLTSSSGCDSIATLNLTVNTVVTSTTNTTICSTQLPYTWNAQTYPTGGTYSVTLTSSSGCDSIATLNLTVNTVVTSTTNTTICSTQLPYTWNAQTYPAGGTYSVTLTSSSGCDSIATLNLTVNTVVTSTTNTTICSTQLPYTWNAQTYPTGGTYSVTLTSSSGCDSIATLNLTVNTVVTSTTNTTICSTQLPYTWNAQTYPAGGTYSVTLTSSSGCDSIATLNLIVNTVVTSTTNTTICSTQLPYTWNAQTYPAGGTYSVTLTSSSGCDSIATLNLTVNTVVTSTTNTTICSTQLPYTWNAQTYPTGGTYSVTLTSSSGCDSIATLNLTVYTVVTSTTNTTICSTQLPYTWNAQTYPAGGTYSVTLTSSSGCDSIATLNLTVSAVVTSTTNTTICSTQLPYAWNAQTYPAGGTYSVTLTSSSGCDSIATLNLTVNNVVTSTTNTTICSTQLPYTWNAQTYPAGGTYSVTLTSSSGCDSIATLNLTVSAVVTSTTNTTICSTQLPYTWNAQTYPTGGTYSVTLTSSSGCDSIATLNLTVSAVVTSTTNTTICSTQLPYTWNAQTYPAGGTYSVTLTSSSGCDSIATLNLTVNTVVTSTTNTTICSTQLPYTWNAQTYPTGGTYSVTLTSSSGCDSIATLNLTVNTVVTSTTNTTICSTQLPYTWNAQTYPAGGTYSVTLTSSSGCDSIATLNLTVNTVVTSTTNTTICSTQLPYTWNAQTYPTGGTYSVTLTSSSGCDSIATLNLTVNTVVTSTTNTTICSTQLPYTWNAQTYPAGGTYSVTLTSSSGCDSIATLNLIVNTVVTSTTNTTICSTQLPYTWNAQTYPAGGTYSVTLTSSSGCDSIATLNLTVNTVVTSTTNTTICSTQLPYTWNAQTYPTGGTYSVTLTSSSGCDSIATLNLTVYTVVTSTTNTTICSTQLPYTWNAQTYPTGGTYSVTLTSTSGCDSIATLNLTVNTVVTSTTNTIICSTQLPYTWNAQTYPAGGTYSVTLTSSSGCDSIATLNLIVNTVVTSTTNTTICSTQLPYTWNAQTYPAGGTYSVTLTSSSGCDSIATLNLTVNTVVTSTTNTTICSTQLPYTWNAQTYPTGGTYSVTLTSSSGCDSIATLNLIVNTVVTSTTNTTICSTQLPYTWNAQTYPAGGTYSVTLTSSSGCDSIATLNLTVNTVVTSTTNTTICSTQLPYTWNAQTYPAGGTYSVTLTSSSGCDSIATLNLTVSAVVSSTTNITICSNQLPYSWNGQSYSTAGPHVITLVSSLGCDSIATLNLTVNPVVTSTTNVTICSNQLPYSWNGQSYSTAGPHIVTLVSSLGCDSIATLNLTVNPVVSSTTNTSTCNNHLPFIWNGQSYTIAGTYTVTLTSSAGCDSLTTLHLVINPVVSSTTNASTCSSQLPYIWNGQSYSTAGPHTVILTSSAGCDSLATLNLTINQSPGAPTVTSPVNYCQYAIASALTATGSNQLLWYTAPTGGIGSTIAPVPATTIPGTFNYYVSQSNGICESPRNIIAVKVNGKPALGIDKSLKICFGNTADLTTLYNTGGLTGNWTYAQAPVTNPSAVMLSGYYQLEVTNASGCSDTAIVTLTMQPPVIANAGDDGNAEYNIPYQLHGSGGIQYLWSPASPLNNAQIASPLATLTGDTKFTLMVMDEIGCKAYDTVLIRVFKGPTFYVPTAFTPNGDGVNDIFRPTSVGISKLEYFRVYNRYGELLYETSEIAKGWDGMYKGVKQNIGTYVWAVKGIDRKGEVKTMKGYVVLIR